MTGRVHSGYLRTGQSVLHAYDGEDLRTYPVSRAVNSPDNDSPFVIEAVDVGEQTGLDEFAE